MAGTPAPASGGQTWGAPGGNSTGAAKGGSGGPSNPANAAMFAARKLATQEQLKIYAASLCGLIAIFVVFHWTRWLCRRVDRSMKTGHGSLFGRPFIRGSRYVLSWTTDTGMANMALRMVRNILVRKILGFKSAGHALLITTFVAINLAVTFTNLDTSSNTAIASRFAW